MIAFLVSRLKQKNTLLIVFFFVCLSLFRLTLIDRGVLTFPDEVRSEMSFVALSKMLAGDFVNFCRAINMAEGRPGYVLMYMFPAYFQLKLLKWGIMPDNPVSLMIPAFLNLVASLVAVYFFYRISRILFKERFTLVFLGTVVYGLLVNSNFYIRHLLGCDIALAFFMAALYLCLRPRDDIFSYAAAGVCAGLTFYVYPGYYYAIPLIGCAAVFKSGLLSGLPGFDAQRVTKFICWLVSLTAVAGFFAYLAYKGGIDYFKAILSMDASVSGQGGSHGAFEEGFLFLPKYLIQVETFIGVWLMALSVKYIVKQARFFITHKSVSQFREPLHFILGIACVGYCFHAVRTFVFHKALFHARFLHLYFPFLVWAAVSAIGDTDGLRRRLILGRITLAAVCLSFMFFAYDYYTIAYPSDVLYRMRINTNLIVGPNASRFSPWVEPCNAPPFYCETGPFMKYYSPGAFNIRTNAPYTMKNNYILVNFGFFSPGSPKDEFFPYSPPEGARLVYEAPHFMTFPAYVYEGFTPEYRELFIKRNYKVRIYEIL